MNPAAHRNEDNALAPVLYMAVELSNKSWRLTFGDGAKRRQVSVPAADLAKLACAVAKAKEHWGMPASARVVRRKFLLFGDQRASDNGSCLRLQGPHATGFMANNRTGVIMAYPELEALIDLVGRATALETLLQGRVFGAAEAKEKGLVTRVVPDDKVTDEALAAVRRIAEGAPFGNRWHKKFARRLRNPKKLSRGEYLEGFANCDTEDYQEAIRRSS